MNPPKDCLVNVVPFNDLLLIVSGRFLTSARIHDEEWLTENKLHDPETLIDTMKKEHPYIDIFSFSQKLPDVLPKYEYSMEWDNLAVIYVSSFEAWWKCLPQVTRKNVRRSAKRGVVVRPVPFDDDLVNGISLIYNETPIRQGRRFWHYNKNIAIVKRENCSYLENSEFIGAYFNNQLIGFIKIVYSGVEARIMQIVSMIKHQDKRTTNALISKAVEMCATRKMKYFIYGKYVYGKRQNSPMTEFKKRNGFVMVNVPRYFIPLSKKGEIALKTGFHKGLEGILPGRIINAMIDCRVKFYEKIYRRFINKREIDPDDGSCQYGPFEEGGESAPIGRGFKKFPHRGGAARPPEGTGRGVAPPL